MKKNLKIVFIFAIILSVTLISSNSCRAETPEEFCQHLSEGGIPDQCTVCGDCSVITTNVGNNECKKCPEAGGCQLVTCDQCAEYPACVEE